MASTINASSTKALIRPDIMFKTRSKFCVRRANRTRQINARLILYIAQLIPQCYRQPAMDIRHLTAFIAVAEEGSFRNASRRLHIAQPALSRTVQGLEQELGVMLLKRTTRNVTLTEPGRHLLERGRQIIKDLNDAAEATRRIDRGEKGELYIGFNDFTIADQLPSVIQSFRSRHADIKLNLVSEVSAEMIEMVLDKRLDIAFLSGVPAPGKTNHMVIREEKFVCVVPRQHRLANRETVSLKELSDEDFVMGYEDWEVFLDAVDKFCSNAGFKPRVIQRAVHSDGIVNLVAAGVGITIYVEKPWLSRRDDVALVSFKEKQPTFNSVAVWRKTENSNCLHYLIDTLKETVTNGHH